MNKTNGTHKHYSILTSYVKIVYYKHISKTKRKQTKISVQADEGRGTTMAQLRMLSLDSPIEALGNGVVWPVAHAVFAAIVTTEEAHYGR